MHSSEKKTCVAFMDLWIIHCSSEQNEKHVPQYCFLWPLIWMWWPVNKCSFNFIQKWLTENELEAYTEPSTVTVFPFVLSLILLLGHLVHFCWGFELYCRYTGSKANSRTSVNTGTLWEYVLTVHLCMHFILGSQMYIVERINTCCIQRQMTSRWPRQAILQ